MSVLAPALTARPGTVRAPVAGGRLRAAVDLLLYLALAVALFHDAWVDPTRRFIGVDSDARIFIWWIAALPHALSHADNPFFTTWIHWPVGVNAMWNTSVIFPALVVAPITVTAGPVAAYDLLTTAAIAGSAFAMRTAAHRYVGHASAATVAGLVYGFAPAHLAQAYGHLNFDLLVFCPLVLLLADEVLVRQRRRVRTMGLCLGLAAVAQLLTGEEVLVLCAVVALPAIAALALAHRERVAAHLPYARRVAVIAAVVAVAVAAYPLWLQFFGPQRLTTTVQQPPPWTIGTDLTTFFLPNQLQQFRPAAVAAWNGKVGNSLVEDSGYVGIPLLTLCVVGALGRRRRPVALVASTVALVAAVLSLGTRLEVDGRVVAHPLPWAAFRHLPLLEDVVPARFVLVGGVGVALLAALATDAAMGAPRWRRRGGLLLTAVALASVTPHLPFPVTADRTPAAFRTGYLARTLPEATVVLLVPFTGEDSSRVLLWQADAQLRFRMPVGFAIVPDSSYDHLPSVLLDTLAAIDAGARPPALSPPLAALLRRDLGRLGVDVVVVGPGPRHQISVAFLTELLRRAPQSSGGVDVWYNVADVDRGVR